MCAVRQAIAVGKGITRTRFGQDGILVGMASTVQYSSTLHRRATKLSNLYI